MAWPSRWMVGAQSCMRFLLPFLAVFLLLLGGWVWLEASPSVNHGERTTSIAQETLSAAQAHGSDSAGEEDFEQAGTLERLAAPDAGYGSISFRKRSNWNGWIGVVDVWILPFEGTWKERRPTPNILRAEGSPLKLKGAGPHPWPIEEPGLWLYAEHDFLKSQVVLMQRPAANKTIQAKLEGTRTLAVDVWDAEGQPVADVPVLLHRSDSTAPFPVESRTRTNGQGQAQMDFDSVVSRRDRHASGQMRVLEIPILGAEPVRTELLGDVLPRDGVRVFLPTYPALKIKLKGAPFGLRGRITLRDLHAPDQGWGQTEERRFRGDEILFPRVGANRTYEITLQESHQVGTLTMVVDGPSATETEPKEVVFDFTERLSISGRLIFPETASFRQYNYRFYLIDRGGTSHEVGRRANRGQFLLRLGPEWKGVWAESFRIEAHPRFARKGEADPPPPLILTFPIRRKLEDSVQVGEVLPESVIEPPKTLREQLAERDG